MQTKILAIILLICLVGGAMTVWATQRHSTPQPQDEIEDNQMQPQPEPQNETVMPPPITNETREPPTVPPQENKTANETNEEIIPDEPKTVGLVLVNETVSVRKYNDWYNADNVSFQLSYNEISASRNATLEYDCTLEDEVWIGCQIYNGSGVQVNGNIGFTYIRGEGVINLKSYLIDTAQYVIDLGYFGRADDITFKLFFVPRDFKEGNDYIAVTFILMPKD